MSELVTLIAFLLIAYVVFKSLVQESIVFEYQKGLLYADGKFVRLLEPGKHRYYKPGKTVQLVDMRAIGFTINGQEVLTADNVGLKVSLAVNYRVGDPAKAMHTQQQYSLTLYTEAQLALRDAIGSLNVEDLLKSRAGLGKELLSKVAPQAETYGVIVESVEVKDVMFPAELRKIFAEVIRAQKEGLAALERARGETASLRNLANASKLLENNPALMNLRVLQSIAGTNATVVLGTPSGIVPLPSNGGGVPPASSD